MIIDSHIHLFSPSVCSKRDDYFDDTHFSLLYRDKSARIIDHNELLKAMEKNAVDISIAMGFMWRNARYCEEQNRYLGALYRETGGRIIPFGTVPLMANIDIDRWVADFKTLGLHGIGEIAFYEDGLNREHAAFLDTIFTVAEKYELPVCLHLNEPVGHAYQGKYDPDLSRISSIIQRHPGVTVVLAHWGGGLLFYELMPELSSSLKNTYYDTAASPFLFDSRIYTIALDIIGSKKILFGSDYPLIEPARYLEPINRIDGPGKINDIVCGNASRILKIKV